MRRLICKQQKLQLTVLHESKLFIPDLKQNSEPRVLMGNVVDIEDLVGYGQKNK